MGGMTSSVVVTQEVSKRQTSADRVVASVSGIAKEIFEVKFWGQGESIRAIYGNLKEVKTTN
jgi:hypothetical protein